MKWDDDTVASRQCVVGSGVVEGSARMELINKEVNEMGGESVWS